jgi:hypothetical protein
LAALAALPLLLEDEPSFDADDEEADVDSFDDDDEDEVSEDAFSDEEELLRLSVR